MNIIAECIAQAGYGTSSYDPETHECEHECYASIVEVISNKEYWDQYENMLSEPLNNDFGLGFNFSYYKLIVYSDGSREAEEQIDYKGKRLW